MAFREALQNLLNDAAYINAMGGTTFLTGVIGLSSADAATVMSTVGEVTSSNSVVQSIQAWIASSEPLWGGQ